MTNRNVRRIQSKITAITALAALLSLCFVMGAEAKPTTKRKPKPKPKPITTRPAKTTPGPPTTVGSNATTPNAATPNAATPEAVTAAYQHYADVRYKLLVDSTPYKTDLPKIASGAALKHWLDYYGDIPAGNRWSGKRDEFKAIDFRVQSINEYEAVARVCEWTSDSPMISPNGKPVPGSANATSDDLQITFRSSTKLGWIVTDDLRLQAVDGKSTCADGKI
jgi:hypothetical protein